MPNLTKTKPSATQRVLIYGEPKTGKTQLAGVLAANHPMVWFDLENGFTTLLKLPVEQQENITLIQIPDTKVYPIAIETMLKVLTGNKVEICLEHGKVACPLCKKAGAEFDTVHLNGLTKETIVVIDSLTQLSNSAMAHLLRNEEDTYKPEWSDYRNQGALLDKVLSTIQQAHYNIIAITHVVETELEDGSKKLVPLCGTTAFSRNTAKYFDHVVLTEMKNKTHRVASSTNYSVKALTGSRTDIALENKDSILDIFSGTKGNKEPVVKLPPVESKKLEEAKDKVKSNNSNNTAALLAAARAKAAANKN